MNNLKRNFYSKSKTNYSNKLRFKESILIENNLLNYIFIPYDYKDNVEKEMNLILDWIKYANLNK